jgi:hypothetical protein
MNPLPDLEEQLKNLSKVKLPGGIVGKTTLLLICGILIVGPLAAYTGNPWIIGGTIAGILLLLIIVPQRLITLAEKFPQAALLEGAELLFYKQLEMASKDKPAIDVTSETIPEVPTQPLSSDQQALVDAPDTTIQSALNNPSSN